MTRPVRLDLQAIEAWWRQTYPRLAEDLGFDMDEDHAAAVRLAELLDANDLQPVPLEQLKITGGAVVAGAADNLADDLSARPPVETEALLVADGALPGALAETKPPHLIVTDLDGAPDQVARLNQNGVPVAVHAHGDNLDALERWVPRLTGPLLATRQTPGTHPETVLCPGGFADGDRAVLLAGRLGARNIRLVGFDLHGPPGKASPTEPMRKRRKMKWSARILDEARGFGLPLESDDQAGS